MIPVLQLSWVVDFAPNWLGPALLLAGLFVSTVPVTYRVVKESRSDFNRTPALILMAVGFVILGIPTVLKHLPVYALTAFLLVKFIEGKASARFYEKVWYFVTTRRIPSSPGSRIVYYLLFILILTTAVSVTITLVEFDIIDSKPFVQVSGPATVIYTLYVVCSATLGLVYRFWGTSISSELNVNARTSVALVTGAILMFVGAEIYNFTLILDGLVGLLDVGASIGFVPIPDVIENAVASIVISIAASVVFVFGYLLGILSVYYNPRYY